MALAAVPARAAGQTGVVAASTPDGSEVTKTVPITPSAGTKPRVALSLGPGVGTDHLPALAPGDTLHTSAELQVSTTCVVESPRCIGHRYAYSPTFAAQIVLTDSPDATTGPDVAPVTGRFEHGCGQRRPNRNHHCVLTLADAPVTIPDQLPCAPGSCYLNLVVDAHHPAARKGDVLVIGNDQPDGTVKGGRGRLNAIVVPPPPIASVLPPTESFTSLDHLASSIPLGSEDSGFQTVVYSTQIPAADVHVGDVLAVNALDVTGIKSLPLPAFVGTQLIVAGSPTAVKPKRTWTTEEGSVTPANGFNCTKGRSPYRTPCSSYKAGVVTVEERPINNSGQPKPLYVNLVARSFLKVAQGKRQNVVRVKPGGYINIARYPAP